MLTLTRRSEPPKIDLQALRTVGSRLLDEWTDLRDRRQGLDQQMLENHWQYRSRYSPDEMQRIQQIREDACQLYLGLTRTKVRTLDSRINEMAFSAGGPTWGVDPTPEPEPTQDAVHEAMMLAQSDPEAARKSLKERLAMVMRRRADGMQTQMLDHLVEQDYERLFRMVTHAGHKHSAGILKGPLVTRQMRKRWGQMMVDQGEGKPAMASWRMKEQGEAVVPYFEVCSPWDMYLDWNARRPQDSDWYFQRHVFSRRKVAALGQHASFFKPALQAWFNENPEGDAQWENWESQLYDTARNQTARGAKRHGWELIEGWGALTAEELLSLGMESHLESMGIKLDEMSAALMEAHIWFTRNGDPVGLSLNHNYDESRPYSFYIPTPDDDSVYGTSFPETARPVEKGYTGAWRMLFDNAATTVLPQIEVRYGRLLTKGDIRRMQPGQIWAVNEQPWNSANPAIQFTDFPNHTAVFLALINALQVQYDEITGLPRYQHGASAGGGAGRTASGLAMLMGAAGQLVKDQLRAWDDFQKDVLTKLFNWEMQFNPRPEIKGDMRIHVKTTISVLQKAEQAQAMQGVLALGANPAYGQYMKLPNLLRKYVEALDLDPDEVVKTPEDMQAELEAMAAEQAAQQEQAEAEGMSGAAPEGNAGQPPQGPPAPGAGAGVPMAEGGYVNESIGDVVGRLGHTNPEYYGPAPRIPRRGNGATPAAAEESIESLVASVEDDYNLRPV